MDVFNGRHFLFPALGEGMAMHRKDRCVASLCFAQPCVAIKTTSSADLQKQRSHP
jgi:hypothetical protein